MCVLFSWRLHSTNACKLSFSVLLAVVVFGFRFLAAWKELNIIVRCLAAMAAWRLSPCILGDKIISFSICSAAHRNIFCRIMHIPNVLLQCAWLREKTARAKRKNFQWNMEHYFLVGFANANKNTQITIKQMNVCRMC